MEKVSISISYNVKCWINDYLCLTECGKIVNTNKGVLVKQFLRGSKPAFYLNGIATKIEEIKPYEKNKCPF